MAEAAAAAVAAPSVLTNLLGTTATVTTIGQFLSGMYVYSAYLTNTIYTALLISWLKK